MSTESMAFRSSQKEAASIETSAVQSNAPVLADAYVIPLASLDGSLAGLHESLGKLKVAKSVDILESIDQLKMAVESARVVSELVWAELPEASWQNREELDALFEKIRKLTDARILAQLRSRLLALSTELERSPI